MNFFYKAKIAYETKQETASENVVSSLRTNQNKHEKEKALIYTVFQLFFFLLQINFSIFSFIYWSLFKNS